MKLRVDGEVAVPGDKSISHRALMLAAAAVGESRLRGLSHGGDCGSTARVLRTLGVPVPSLRAAGGELRIASGGLESWRAPAEALDCGNSGTTARLMLGLLASRSFTVRLTGDASLRARPMARISEPLRTMGARITDLESRERLPLEITGGPLRAIEHRSAQASAQVKSGILLAGVGAGVAVTVIEPFRSRDHTERLLRCLGLPLREDRVSDGWRVHLEPSAAPLPPLDLSIPGDPSSAAFLVALALLASDGELRIRGVATNPTRSGFLNAVARMGGECSLETERLEGGEPLADLLVRPSSLRAFQCAPPEIPSLIDELPVLAMLAARAHGETRVTGAAELRAKESDRIATLVENLRGIGVRAEELEDGFVIEGSDRPLAGTVHTNGDHRIAMAFGVLAAVPENRIRIDRPEVVDISFPGYWDVLRMVAGGRGSHPLQAR